MAVPKKRTSRSKKNSRKSTWMQKGNVQAKKAYSLAKSVLSGKSTSFIYSSSIGEQTDED
jgi:large subunit ribosomal protein L32